MKGTKEQESIKLIDRIAQDTYVYLGVDRNNTRAHYTVKVRAAIAVASLKYFTFLQVAKALSRDRGTIYHYTNEHDANMKYWEGYKKAYITAKGYALDIAGTKQGEKYLKDLTQQIKDLEEAKALIEMELAV
tara:strand:- start:484 stop:879 length:396 start_codon:yes stop_codon:yes gene_type:complete